jgi:hypothetical protein
MGQGKSVKTSLFSSALTYYADSQRDFTLPSLNSKLECTGNTADDLPFRVPIQFGKDSVSGCSVYYTPTEITQNCDAIRSRIVNIQQGFNKDITHVAMFANASYLNVNEWMQIFNTPPSTLTVRRL